MTQTEPSPEEQRKIDLIEALLYTAYSDGRSTHDGRIEQVMSKIDVLRPTLATKPRFQRSPSWKRLWMSSIVATLLMACVFVFQAFSGSQQLMAAIQKGISAAAEDIARHYRVTAVYRNVTSPKWMASKLERDENGDRAFVVSDLYVRGNEQFALRHPALLPNKDLWLGQSAGQTWVVPSIGTVRFGNKTLLAKWLSAREKISTPYLHVTTVLFRMQKGYTLSESKQAKIGLQDGSEIVCRQIAGVRKAKLDDKFPERIEFWSDVETGLVLRMNIDWNLEPGEAGRERIEIEFMGQPELADDWFLAEGHYTGFRRQVELSAGDELD
jgi:hypothetical protein